jgi:hypothetical protein
MIVICLKDDFAINCSKLETMALPVMEFQDQGYKIRKIFA